MQFPWNVYPNLNSAPLNITLLNDQQQFRLDINEINELMKLKILLSQRLKKKINELKT